MTLCFTYYQDIFFLTLEHMTMNMELDNKKTALCNLRPLTLFDGGFNGTSFKFEKIKVTTDQCKKK